MATLNDATGGAPATTVATSDASVGVVGVDTEYARQDHEHQIVTTGTPGAATPGDTAAPGISDSLTRVDHQHSLPAFGVAAGEFCEGDDSRIPTQGENDALAGTGGTPPSATNVFLAESDFGTIVDINSLLTDGPVSAFTTVANEASLSTAGILNRYRWATAEGTLWRDNGTSWEAAGGGGAEVNDLTAAVTWANIPDANVPESSVTQHEGAIDHDQLTNYLAGEHVPFRQLPIASIGAADGTKGFFFATDSRVLLYDSGSWVNLALDASELIGGVSDASITESSVTQHEGAIDHDALTNFVAAEHRVINEGTAALRDTNFPAASHSGEYHFSTDTGAYERSNGTTYDEVGITVDNATLEATTDLHVKAGGIDLAQLAGTPTALYKMRSNATNNGIEWVPDSGDGLGFGRWTFEAATIGTPAANSFQSDAVKASTTALRFDALSLDTNDLGGLLDSMRIGDRLYLRSTSDSTNYGIYIVDVAPTLVGGDADFSSVIHEKSSGAWTGDYGVAPVFTAAAPAHAHTWGDITPGFVADFAVTLLDSGVGTAVADLVQSVDASGVTPAGTALQPSLPQAFLDQMGNNMAVLTEVTAATGDKIVVERAGVRRKIDANDLLGGAEVNDLEANVTSVLDNEVFVGTGADTGTYIALPTTGAVSFNGTAFSQANFADLGGAVAADDFADNTIVPARLATQADSGALIFNATGVPAYLGPGASGQVLTSGGTGVIPAWAAAAGGGGVTITQAFSYTADLNSATYYAPLHDMFSSAWTNGGGVIPDTSAQGPIVPTGFTKADITVWFRIMTGGVANFENVKARAYKRAIAHQAAQGGNFLMVASASANNNSVGDAWVEVVLAQQTVAAGDMILVGVENDTVSQTGSHLTYGTVTIKLSP